MEELLYEILKHNGIRRPPKNPRQNNTILGIRREYLVSLSPMELRDLDRCHP
jgi:hypothetical protein